jgi:hypothetical protein
MTLMLEYFLAASCLHAARTAADALCFAVTAFAALTKVNTTMAAVIVIRPFFISVLLA